MSGELLKTIFVQNKAGFRSIELLSTEDNITNVL